MDLERIDVVCWLDQILDQDPATFDGYARGKLLELLGESGDSTVIPTLRAELQHPLEEVRNWAQLALDALDQGASWQPSMGA